MDCNLSVKFEGSMTGLILSLTYLVYSRIQIAHNKKQGRKNANLLNTGVVHK